MANTPQNNPSNEPWRGGRPSFKAFYPEIFLLTLVTIAFIAGAMKLSCNALKKDKAPEAEKAAAVQLETIPFSSLAFAQDGDINAAVGEDATLVLDEPVAEEPVVEEPVAEEPVAEEPVADEPAADAGDSAKGDASGSKQGAATKILWYWIVCMFVPLILWIWRGCVWLCAVWGVYYELRVDPDNPRATTFLTTRGIFNKSTDSMHIGAIKDIRSQQSFFQKYFMGGVGTIVLDTSDKSDAVLEMKNMANPSRVFNALDELRRHYWSRGGLQFQTGAGAGTDGIDGEADFSDGNG